MEQLVHWIHATLKVDNVRANHQFVAAVVMNAKMDHLTYLVEVYSVAKIVVVTLAVLLIRFVAN